MPWLRLDDDFITNEKILLVSKDAKLLYFWSLGYAARELTDGLIKSHVVRILAGMAGIDDAEAATAELMSAGLWEQDGEEYRVTDEPGWRIMPDPTTQEQRNCREYEKWRQVVLERDGYRCTLCRSPDDLHVHHVRAWAGYPNLRFSVENGSTLCRACHMALHGLMPAEEGGT